MSSSKIISLVQTFPEENIIIFSVHITVSCQMNFDDYPLDAHSCQFQVGSCKYLIMICPLLKLWKRDLLPDYDTQEVVTCNAHFIYDEKRQRSLQHEIQIQQLSDHFKTVRLPSGEAYNLTAPLNRPVDEVFE